MKMPSNFNRIDEIRHDLEAVSTYKECRVHDIKSMEYTKEIFR